MNEVQGAEENTARAGDETRRRGLLAWWTVVGVAVLAITVASRGSAPPAVATPASAAPVVAVAANATRQDATRSHRIAARQGRAPLAFEANDGQAAADVRWVARTPQVAVDVLDAGLRFHARRPSADGTDAPARTTTLRLLGTTPGRAYDAREPRPGVTHRLVGAPAQWRRDIVAYAQLRRDDVWPGIDLVHYGRDDAIEHDFVVEPGADPSRIRFVVEGAAPARIEAASGDLLLDGGAAPGAPLRLRAPEIYQVIDGERRPVAGAYRQARDGSFGFTVAAYDRTRPLVIDPVIRLLYGTYLGGVHDDQVGGMTVDAQGNAYVVGYSGSEDWPVSGNAYQATRKALGSYVRNVVVTKFDPAGTLVYSTFIGGTTNDYGKSIAVDASGRAYVSGTTNSPDYPVTAGAHQGTYRGSQSAFLSVLSSDGSSLVYSSFYGGSGGANVANLALDGAVVVIGGTAGPGLPTTAGAYKTTLATGIAPYVARFDLAQTGSAQLQAATYYGTDAPQTNFSTTGAVEHGLAIDAAGTHWIVGQAYTTNLPTTAGAPMPAPTAMTAGCSAGSVPLNSFAFVARLSADLKSLAYGSYLTGYNGGPATCAEYAYAIAFDAAGGVFVGGTTSSLAFPVTAGTAQSVWPGPSGGFDGYASYVAKLDPAAGSIVWSTFLGGQNGRTYMSGIALDGAGAPWVAMSTAGGSAFPVTADALQPAHGGGSFDGAYVKLDAASGALRHGSYFGGAGDDGLLGFAVDRYGTLRMAGHTTSRNFPVTANALQPGYTANAYDGNDWTYAIVGTGTISRVWPQTVGNGGDATLQVGGAGFASGATVALVQGATRVAASVVGVHGDTSLDATFPLAGVAPGRYDLVVQNPTGEALSSLGAVTVGAGGAPEVWANIVGRPAIRTGVAQTFNVVVGNAGSVDAYFTRVWISFPASLSYTIADGVSDPDVPGVDLTSLAAETVVSENRTYIPVIVPLLRAGETSTLPIGLRSPTDSEGLDIRVFTRPPWFDSRQRAFDALAQATAAPGGLSRVCGADAARPAVRNCLGEYVIDSGISVVGRLQATLADTAGAPSDAALDPALETQARLLAIDYLRTSLTDSIANASARGPRITLAAKGRPELRNPVLVGAAAAAGLWILSKLGDWLFGKVMESLVKPPVVDPTQDPRFVRKTTERSKCVNGQLTVTETYYFEKPDGTKVKTFHEKCGSMCPKKPHAGGGGHSKPALTTGWSANAVPALRLAKSGSCPSEPPDECEDVGNPDDNGTGGGGGGCSGSGGAIDPNDKFGTSGDGTDDHWVRSATPLTYQLAFENLPGAALPAAQVVVSDQLDPALVDLSTLTLGNISWGAFRIDVPAGLKSYAAVQPIDSTMSVRVQGSVDTTSGLLKWTFTTVDPLTKLPPSDPTLGFLPPDTDGARGQGYVAFNVMPKAGLADGTSIRNAASVVFDANAPIVTPTWVNAIDDTAPSSRVQSLTGRVGERSFDVAWSSPADAGSPLRSYTVYVSDNDGAWTAWQTATTATSATYAGVDGHRYAFHAIATDGAGNTEAAKTAAEATLTVNGPFGTDPGDATGGGGGGCTLGDADQRDASLPALALCALLILAWRRRQRALRRAAWRQRELVSSDAA